MTMSAATDVPKSNLMKPMFNLNIFTGSSLTEDQKNQTLSKLGYDASKDTKDIKTMTPDIYSKVDNG